MTWTVDDWGWALEKYTEDCNQLDVDTDRKIRPDIKINLPYEEERLSLEPDKEKIRVIHVGAYFGNKENKEMFLMIVRLVLSTFPSPS